MQAVILAVVDHSNGPDVCQTQPTSHAAWEAFGQKCRLEEWCIPVHPCLVHECLPGVSPGTGWHRCSAQLLVATPLGETGLFFTVLIFGASNIWQAVTLAAYFSGENKSHRGVISVTLCTQARCRNPLCCHLARRVHVRCSWMLSSQGGSGILSGALLADSQRWSIAPADMLLIKGIWGLAGWGEEGVSFGSVSTIMSLLLYVWPIRTAMLSLASLAKQRVDNIVKCTAEFWLLGVWTNSRY